MNPAACQRLALGAAYFAVCLLFTGACGRTGAAAPAAVAPDLAPALDLNADPHIFEMDLQASETTAEYRLGQQTPVWAYNGSVPGPLVELAQGDTLSVHFHNNLPQNTTIHWHGIRLPNAMDGSLAVQNPLPPVGSFEYKFALQDPGLYWFHPHHRSDEQTAKGMYGVILVRGANEPQSDFEHILVLDDATLDAGGKLPTNLSDYHKMDEHQMFHGRSGPDILVNGRVQREIELQVGAIHRFRFLNAANLRVFNLRVPGHQWRVIGSDGGFFEKPYDVNNLVIGPAERYDALLIATGAVGDAVKLESDAFPRAEDDPQAATSVCQFRLTGPALSGRTLPTALPGLMPARLPVPADGALPIEFDFGTTGGLQDGKLPAMGPDPIPQLPGDPIFYINKHAGMDVPDLTFKLGEVRKFRIHNISHQYHVFHLHGFFFQVVETDDLFDAKLNPFGLQPQLITQAQKDTVAVREGYSVTVVARFDALGTWMYHCHIPEHSERGMMAAIHVVP